MSAPNPGRQSPDPERQTGAQQQAPPAGDVNKQGGDEGVSHKHEDQTAGLSSNPTHPLEKFAEEKTSKK